MEYNPKTSLFDFQAYHPDNSFDGFQNGELVETVNENADSWSIQTSSSGEKVMDGLATLKAIKKMQKVAEMVGGVVVQGKF